MKIQVEVKDAEGKVLKSVEVPVVTVAAAYRDEVAGSSQVMATASLLDYVEQVLKPISDTVVNVIGREANRRPERKTLPLGAKTPVKARGRRKTPRR